MVSEIDGIDFGLCLAGEHKARPLHWFRSLVGIRFWSGANMFPQTYTYAQGEHNALRANIVRKKGTSMLLSARN